MQYAKLTLRPPQEVIDLARRLAAERHLSITQMFSNYILRQKQEQDHRQEECPVGPLLERALHLADDVDLSDMPDNYEQTLTDALCERFLEGKRK